MKRYTGLLAFALSCVVCLGGVGVFADVDVSGNDILQDVSGNDVKENTVEESIIEEEVANYVNKAGDSAVGTENTSASVDLEIKPNFSIVIPKNISLDPETKSGEYTVVVNGDIGGNMVVSVTPEDTFTMFQYGKGNITATVSQSKTSWNSNEMNIEAVGTISATDATAGVWEGKLNFNINVAEDNVLMLFDSNGYIIYQEFYDVPVDVSVSKLRSKFTLKEDEEFVGFSSSSNGDVEYKDGDIVHIDGITKLYIKVNHKLSLLG